MTPPRTPAALLAALAAVALAAPAAAQEGTARVNGVVTDDVTGLGVSGVTVAFAPDGAQPTDPVTSLVTGRFSLFGLPAGAGTLRASGPGYTPTVQPVTLQDATDVEVPLRRDWAAVAAGASTTATGAEVTGCEAVKATDGDRATAWSAPSDGQGALVVALPTAITLRSVLVTATAACGHDAGAALGRFRVETSPDGASWTEAASGELGEAQRGEAVELSPTAGTGGVRYVRLHALAAQDAAATTIDVGGVEVHGVGPNEAPAGTLEVSRAPAFAGERTRFTARFTDPDSRIRHYLWDFTGDGRWDQLTTRPSVEHVYGGVGEHTVIVGARDWVGALGRASTPLRVAVAGAPLEPLIDRKPTIGLGEPDGPGVAFRVICTVECRVKARMLIGKRLQRDLLFKRRTVRTSTKVVKPGALANWAFELGPRTLKKIIDSGRDRVRVTVAIRVVDARGRVAKVRRDYTLE